MTLKLHAVSFVQRNEKKRRGERMNAVFKTDRGKVRQHNEDNGGVFLNQQGHLLAIVADGMGGHRAGDVASEMTLNLLREFWEKSNPIENPEQADAWLKEHIEKANALLFSHSKENSECEGMGTTVVAAIVTDLYVTVANIGDSRGYIFNDLGLQQLTEDHSLVNELVRSGQISKEDAEHHPRKNVLLRALGTEEKVTMDIRTISFEQGDMLLLCSDGLSNKVLAEELESVLKEETPLEERAEKLIRLANDYGGEDNITLAVVEFHDDKLETQVMDK